MLVILFIILPSCCTNTWIFVYSTFWIGERSIDSAYIFVGPAMIIGFRIFFTPPILIFLMVTLGF